jgi:hypothetical protein
VHVDRAPCFFAGKLFLVPSLGIPFGLAGVASNRNGREPARTLELLLFAVGYPDFEACTQLRAQLGELVDVNVNGLEWQDLVVLVVVFFT